MDDRPLDDPAAAINALRADLDDIKGTLLAQLMRRPVGDFEITLRTTAKPGTLICDGSNVSRTTYAALWAWAQAQGLVTSGLFTTGDGSTTFGLPDFRGHVLRGKAAAEAIGTVTGADTKTISIANLPAHDHNVGGSTGSDSHNHSGSTSTDGGHSSHNAGAFPITGGGPNSVAETTQGNTQGSHNHDFTTGSDSHSHSLSITESTVGSGTAFDVRQLGKAVNFLVWC